jgi:hypothetical protein
MNTHVQRQLSAQKGFAVTSAPSGMLQRTCACGTHTMAGSECMECGSRNRWSLHTKLQINERGDRDEQDADRIAGQVIATPVPAAVSGTPSRALPSSGSSNELEAPPAAVDPVPAGPGRPLEPGLRREMGHRFGHDFSRVRVHTDERASASAAALGANAYTVGQHVVFRRGAWDPVSVKGRRLIAHELVHTLQQRGSTRPTVAGQFGPLPDTPGGVAAEIRIVQQQLLVPVQPLRPVLEARLQALYVQWHRVGGDAQPAATAPRPTPKKLTPEEETALKAQAVQLALLEVQRRSFCMFMNERADWYAKLRLQEPAFREEMKALHVVYNEKAQSFDLDTSWKYTFNSPYADPRSPFYHHFEAAEVYQDVINAHLYPPEEKGIVRRILDPIVHTICEYTEPCSSNMEQFHQDLENGMSRDEAINRGMARLTTQALVAALPTPGPRGPIALPPGGATPVVPFEPPGRTPPTTGLTPQTVPAVPPAPAPTAVPKAPGGGTAGKLPMPEKPTLIASSSKGKPPEPRGTVTPSGSRGTSAEAPTAAGEIGDVQQFANRIRTDPAYRQAYVENLRRAGYTRARAQEVAANYEQQFIDNPGQQNALTQAALWRLFAELL